MVADSRLPNFRSLTPAERLRHVADAAALSPEDVARLASPGALPLGVADGMSVATMIWNLPSLNPSSEDCR